MTSTGPRPARHCSATRSASPRPTSLSSTTTRCWPGTAWPSSRTAPPTTSTSTTRSPPRCDRAGGGTVGHRVWQPRLLTEPVGEEVDVCAEGNARLRADPLLAPEVRAKDLDRGGVERQAPFLLSLRVLDDPPARWLT